MTLAHTEEALMAVLDDTILNYPEEEDLLFKVDDDFLNLKKNRSLESYRDEKKRLKTLYEDEAEYKRATEAAVDLGVKQPLKCDFLQGRKKIGGWVRWLRVSSKSLVSKSLPRF